jgi:hypothetical protein
MFDIVGQMHINEMLTPFQRRKQHIMDPMSGQSYEDVLAVGCDLSNRSEQQVLSLINFSVI